MKRVFKCKDSAGNEIEFCLVSPTAKQSIEAQLAYNKAWRQAEEKGSIIMRNLDEVATRQGLWSDEKAAHVESMEKEMRLIEKKLRGGANSLSTKEEGRELAIKLGSLRGERVGLLRAKNDLYQYTAECHADMARTQYIIAVTTKYNSNGELYFKGLDDFIAKQDEEVAKNAYIEFIKSSYEDAAAEDDESAFYENIFLKKNGFMNEEGRLVRSDGKYVTEDFKLINKDYKYITEDGKLCDIDGTPVNESGDYDIEYKEFE